jgi:SnoaL-like polyketide cyclase
MSGLLEKIYDLNDLVLQGRALEAFEKYYHDEVIMQENENSPTIGKEANRRREKEFFAAITEFRSAKPVKVTIGEGISMVQWDYDYTHKDWGVRNYSQVSVQEWKDGRIIKEQFFYSN